MIAHASIDERGKAYGGVAGDQTGKEVTVRTWYNASWNIVLRAIEAKTREVMAIAAERLCTSNLVGYDQWQRNDLWTDLDAVNWDLDVFLSRGKKTETDCSELMAVCARLAGINIPRVSLGNGQYNAPVTQTMVKAFISTGQFEALRDSKYLTSDKYLLRGDILVRESGHTAMNLTDGSLVGQVINSQGQATVTGNKSVDVIAREVLAGKWGNAPDRKQRLKNAGYNYDVVQAAVNWLIQQKPQNNELLAMEVLAGQWGNEPQRSQLLTAAGYDAAAVQAEVNRILKRR